MLLAIERSARASSWSSLGFYRTAHQKIFDAIVALYNRNESADSITVTEELRKRGDLEAVGGPPRSRRSSSTRPPRPTSRSTSNRHVEVVLRI
jgi:replicative DNA helicase